ncbi:MAG: VWA domain-containing protein [Deltaproteobacteria bacterium]|nr:VWA domain-containing protein [Deltaproteobacteria bacterium]
MKHRNTNIFSLAFIDCITCGLGAVILLFVIVNARSAIQRNDLTSDLRSEVDRYKKEVLLGQNNLVEARNAMEQIQNELVKTQGLAQALINTKQDKTIELDRNESDTLASKEHINRLKADLKSLEEDLRRLKAGSPTPTDDGSSVRHFAGQGDRQYLTDLKVGGNRVFVLVDASASMLDETIVGIIRKRNLSPQAKLTADKWRHAVSSLDWLLTQLPGDGQFQVYTFNENARPLINGTRSKWLDAGDIGLLNTAVNNLRRIVPSGGTSLINAVNALRSMSPPPDNLFLLTDSLPTMGEKKSWRKTISGNTRRGLFNEAVRLLPPGIPVNILLYPMEGDPEAASAYWLLAKGTRGAFFCPSRDWP